MYGRECRAADRWQPGCGARLEACCSCWIVLVGLRWLAANEALSLAVANTAPVFSLLPLRFVHDPGLQSVTPAVVTVLLAAHIVLGIYAVLYTNGTD